MLHAVAAEGVVQGDMTSNKPMFPSFFRDRTSRPSGKRKGIPRQTGGKRKKEKKRKKKDGAYPRVGESAHVDVPPERDQSAVLSSALPVREKLCQRPLLAAEQSQKERKTRTGTQQKGVHRVGLCMRPRYWNKIK